MREQAGLTLAELSAKAGYSIGTINGLELRGEGSARLKSKLREILAPLSRVKDSVTYSSDQSADSGVEIPRGTSENLSITECRERIKSLEQENAELRIALRVQAREINSAPPSDAARLARRAAGEPPHPES